MERNFKSYTRKLDNMRILINKILRKLCLLMINVFFSSTNFFKIKRILLKIAGISKIHKLPIGRKISLVKDIVSLIKTYLFLKKNKFDAIHSITPKAGFISMIAGLISKTPIRIHTFTGQVWANKSGISKLALKQIESYINKTQI